MRFSVRKNCLVVSLSVVIMTLIMAAAPVDFSDINKSDEPFSYDLEEHNEDNSIVTSENVGLSVGNQFLVRL